MPSLPTVRSEALTEPSRVGLGVQFRAKSQIPIGTAPSTYKVLPRGNAVEEGRKKRFTPSNLHGRMRRKNRMRLRAEVPAKRLAIFSLEMASDESSSDGNLCQ